MCLNCSFLTQWCVRLRGQCTCDGSSWYVGHCWSLTVRSPPPLSQHLDEACFKLKPPESCIILLKTSNTEKMTRPKIGMGGGGRESKQFSVDLWSSFFFFFFLIVVWKTRKHRKRKETLGLTSTETIKAYYGRGSWGSGILYLTPTRYSVTTTVTALRWAAVWAILMFL